MKTPKGAEEFSACLRLREEESHRKRLEAKTAFLEEFNRLLIDSTGDCIVVVNEEGLVLSINQTGCQLLGTLQDEALTRHWTELLPHLRSDPGFAIDPRTSPRFETTSRTLSGDTRFWTFAFTPFSVPANGKPFFLLVGQDVTAHKLAERALRQSEEAFRKIFEENPIGILLADLRGQVTNVNGALSAMLGFSQAELQRKSLRELHAGDAVYPKEDIDRLIHGALRSFQAEAVLRTKRGQTFWGHVTTSVLRDAEQAPVAIFQMIENIQDRKSSEEQVLAYQSQLQTLASELSLGEERERRRLATNLHDRIGQTLAFARLKLAALNQNCRPEEIVQVRGLIDQVIADTRSLTFELSPPVLYELGLVAALEWLTHKIRQEHGVQTRFHDDGQPKPLDEDFRVVLFQAVRELLVNVVKHARATHAQVVLRRDADALRIVIQDDGAGFDVAAVPARRDNRTFGLFNIRERLEYLGGKMKLRSEPGRGTRVTLIAPLKIQGTPQPHGH